MQSTVFLSDSYLQNLEKHSIELTLNFSFAHKTFFDNSMTDMSDLEIEIMLVNS